MKIIKRLSDNTVIFTGEDLYLDANGCGGKGWVSKVLNANNAVVETVDSLPDDFINAGWTYSGGVWASNALGNAHIASKVASLLPQTVTMRQARLALLDASLLSAVKTFIAAQPEETQIYWETSQEIHRDHALVAAVQTALSLTDVDIDNLFIAAAQKV